MIRMVMQRLRVVGERLPFGLRLSLLYFALTRAMFTVLGIGSLQLIGHFTDTSGQVMNYVYKVSGQLWLDVWYQWDSGWYMQIAQHGYTHAHLTGGQADIAYFPLFPYLTRFLSWPFGFHTTAVLAIGLLISSISLIITGYLLYRLAELKFGKEVAKWAVILLYVSPMGFVLSAFLSEGLFILLLTTALLWAAQAKWRRVAVVAGLLLLSRAIGVAAVVVLVLIYLSQQKWSIKRCLQLQSLWLIGPLIGGLLVLLINYLVVGDPLGFAHVELAWGRSLFSFTGPSGGLWTQQGLYLFSYVIGVILLVSFYFKTIGWQYWLLSCLLILIPAMGSLYGLVRYITVIVPLYLIVALFITKRPNWQIPVVVGAALLEAVHFVWWVLGMPIMQ